MMEKVKMLGATPCAIAACMCPIPEDIAKCCDSLFGQRISGMSRIDGVN